MTVPDHDETGEHPSLRLARTENEALFRRFVDDVVNEGRLDVVDDLVSRDLVVHVAGDPVSIRGPDELKARVRAYRRAFPDLTLEVDDLIVTGTEVVGRVTMTGTHEGEFGGIEPTGARIDVERVLIDRLERGSVVERWETIDTHTLRRQLGEPDELERPRHSRHDE